MFVTLASSKGRYSAVSLVQVMHRISSPLLATGVALHVRRLPSERNPSDAASGGKRGVGYWSSAGVTDVRDGRVIAAARCREADARSDTAAGA